MSDLIVIGYENPQTAREAYEQVQRLQRDFIVDLRGLAIVNADADGKTHVDTPQRNVGTSAGSGAKITEDNFTTAMRPFGGTVLESSMSAADGQDLAQVLAGQG
jgi:uncharacterized membrane protein